MRELYIQFSVLPRDTNHADMNLWDIIYKKCKVTRKYNEPIENV